ncbi:MAG: hypothetical protein J7L35_10925 [Anaerolineales bacterium]|nr:hypothetical protein [Anaerolineales bacterium]
MSTKNKTFFRLTITLMFLLIISSCSDQPAVVEDPKPTPTPTKVMQEVPPTQTATPSKCEGLSGEVEVQILVGPADAVGLEPHTVGSIPFAVTTDEPPYLLQGGGGLEYGDILIEEWGTYEVTMNLDFVITGNCEDDKAGGALNMLVEGTGSQLVVVNAEDFHGEYPWEGTVPFDFNFPLEEGASFEGEGYAFVLHLK